jgi:hypothetical protein
MLRLNLMKQINKDLGIRNNSPIDDSRTNILITPAFNLALQLFTDIDRFTIAHLDCF